MWTTLYILCGVSSWLVWTHGGFEKQRVPLTLYGINMLFNLAWNPTFFLFHAMQTAFWDALGMSFACPLLACGIQLSTRTSRRFSKRFRYRSLRCCRVRPLAAFLGAFSCCLGSPSVLSRGRAAGVVTQYEQISCAGIVASLALVIPAFYKVEPLAGLLLLPYLAWAIFALFLNSTLINLNPQVRKPPVTCQHPLHQQHDIA